MNIKELIGKDDFTMDEFWVAVDILPDEFNGKPLKANVRAHFKKDGEPKVKAKKGQDWHDTQGFIRRQVRTQIHLNKLRKHRDAHVQLVRKKKTKTHKVERHGEIIRIREDPVRVEIAEEMISPQSLRNLLVVEYNRLIREGNPKTKKLREQIHEQIQRIEKAEGNSDDSS